MNDSAISVQDLTKIYKLYNNHIDRLKESLHPFRKKYSQDFYALHDINFKIKKGETVGILGKNGAGKSTLLKILTGVLNPSKGTVVINGKVSSLLELGTGFNLELTGLENIFFSGTIMGYSRKEIESKLNNILEFADIEEFVYQPVKSYSSGMYLRLAFAVAINVDPDILIIDEALAVGDIAFQAKCFRKFNEFKSSKKTILFVTHSLDSIIRYCDKAIVLDKGINCLEASPKAAVDYYKKLMVKYYGSLEDSDNNSKSSYDKDEVIFKNNFNLNKDYLEYGNKKADIIDYGIFDAGNKAIQILYDKESFYIKMKVKFNEPVRSPIFAYTIKDLKGFEITGTNTLYKHINTDTFIPGETAYIEFSQILNLRSGQYSLSLGCTGFEGDEFVVYHRLYDLILFEVVSESETVGYYDLNSNINFKKLIA